MACCSSDESKKRNDDISKSLRRDQQLLKREIKLLLLGSGSCGKSTIVKQMRIIHGEGFDEEERKEYKFLINKNVLHALLTLLNGLKELSIEPEPQNIDEFEKIEKDIRYGLDMEVGVGSGPACAMIGIATAAGGIPGDDFGRERLLEYCKRVWSDKGIHSCYAKRNLLQIEDSAI